jgi:hypothetical protein
MFLTNWLMVTRIVAASVIEAVDYPTPEEFFLAFDGTNTLFMYGGSKDTSSTSNVAIYYDGYKHETGNAYPVVLSEPGEYKALVDVCGTRYLTEAVTVGAVDDPVVLINIALNKHIDSASAHAGQYTLGAAGDSEYNDLNFTTNVLTNGFPTDFSTFGANITRSNQTPETGQWHSSSSTATGGTTSPYFRINLETDYYVDNIVLHRTGTSTDGYGTTRFKNVRFQLFNSSLVQIKEVNVGDFGSNTFMTGTCQVDNVRYVKVVTDSTSGYTHYDEIRINGYEYYTQLSYNNYNKLTVANTSNANVETNLRLGANTWDIATASNIWICKPGDYKSFTVDPDAQTAYFGNVTVGTVTEEIETISSAVPARYWRLYNIISTADYWEPCEAQLFDENQSQLSATMSGSSGWYSILPVTNLNDDDDTTRTFHEISTWTTDVSYLEWDLGSEKTVKYFRFKNFDNASRYITGGTFKYSNDGTNFTDFTTWTTDSPPTQTFTWSPYIEVYTTYTQTVQPSILSDTGTTDTLAFHHGNFDNVYGDGTVSNAAANGHVYADTPTGTYSWGTLTANTTTSSNTTYEWTPLKSFTGDVLMVAGGGAGGSRDAGGGGAGGLLHYTNQSLSGSKTVIVGNGGIGTTTSGPGQSGANTSISGYESVIGGGGGGAGGSQGGRDGGSGGGGGGGDGGSSGGLGTTGQGSDGGDGNATNGWAGGGGGGALTSGQNGGGENGGAGGNGKDFTTYFGTNYGDNGYFGGGGGGGGNSNAGAGGIGGGAAGSVGSSDASDAQKHTGGGGGGARISGYYGSSGGSGIVLISDVPFTSTATPSLTYDGYNKLTTVGGYADQTLYKDSNSWSLGTASDVYIAESGEYIYFTRDADTAFLANVVVGSVSVDLTLSETSIVKQFIYDENGYTDAYFSEASETQCIRLSSDGLAMALGDGNYNSNDGRLYYYERSSISDTFTKTHTFDAVSSGLEFGASVDMNAAKTRIAISGSDADNSAANAGRVYIYDRASTSASWPSSPTATITPPASTIKRFGHTVNMSDDGLTMITSGDGNSSTANESGVYVYEYAVTAPSASTISFSSGNFNNNNSYYEKGATTTTTVLYNRRISSEVFTGYGLLLEYQSDGTTKAYANNPDTENLDPNELSIDGVTWTDSVIIAVGDTLRGRQSSTNPGENFVFTVTSEHLFSQGPEWSKTFQVTQGISRFGYKVAMNKEGTRFIAGGTNTAYYVYHKESGTWSSTAALTGETGYHCGMSPDGNTVAVGIVQYSSNLGRVAVYKYSGGSWGSATNIDTTVGSGIYSFGNTPVFNNDGTLLVTGCSGYNSYMGCFEMWKYESGSWVFKNQFLNPTVKTGHGNDTGEFFGGYLSMDYAGTSLIVSNTGNDVAGDDYGRVVLYGAGSLPSLTYDGLNSLKVTGAETSSYITYKAYESNKFLACGTDLTTYPLSKTGNYKAEIAGSNTFTLTSNVLVPATNIVPLYQYPPTDGTTSGVTETVTADENSIWTVSGAGYGNGLYHAQASVAATSTSVTAYHAFDNNLTAGFETTSSTIGTLRVQLPSTETVHKYVVWPKAADGNRPKSWIIEGSQDAATWTTIHTVTDSPPSLSGDIHEISSPAAYVYYRINVSANNGGTGLEIAELVLWGDVAFSITFSDGWVTTNGATNVTLGSSYTLPTYTSSLPVTVTGASDFDVNTTGTYVVVYTSVDINELVRRVVRRFVVA